MTSMRRCVRRHVPAGNLAPLAPPSNILNLAPLPPPPPPPPQYSKPSYAYVMYKNFGGLIVYAFHINNVTVSFIRNNCALFVFLSFLNRGQLIKERICSAPSKFSLLFVDPFLKVCRPEKQAGSHKSCLI